MLGSYAVGLYCLHTTDKANKKEDLEIAKAHEYALGKVQEAMQEMPTTFASEKSEADAPLTLMFDH